MIDLNGWKKQADAVNKGNGWGLTALTIGLFLVTGYRTAHYIWGTLPPEWWFIAIAGVFAFDGGALLWARAWEGNATNKDQDAIASAMFVLDVVGMFLTSLADSVDPKILPSQVTQGVMIAVPSIIVINVIAGFVYSMVSDATQLARAQRAANAELARAQREAENQIKIAQATIAYQQDWLDKQEALLVQQEKIAEQTMRLEATKRGLEKAAHQGDHITDAAESIAQRTREHFTRTMHGNGNGHWQTAEPFEVEAVKPNRKPKSNDSGAPSPLA